MRTEKDRQLLQQPTAERGATMKNTTNYSTTISSRRTRIITILIALVLAVIAFTGNYGTIRARAEETTTNAWALCKTYINIRLWPSKEATAVGFLDPCDRVEVDGRTKNGFAHIVEPVDGWVYAGYLTFSEPQAVGETYTVVAPRRVAARRWVDGPQMGTKPWLINGSEVTVLYMSDDWALTNRGYVKAEWLEAAP